MAQPEQSHPQRRRQFGLRTRLMVVLLMVVTAVAILAASLHLAVEPYRAQRDAIAVIQEFGGTYKAEVAAWWICCLDENATDVVSVDLAHCDAPAEYVRYLTRLPKLQTLAVGGHPFGDDELRMLESHTDLRSLFLDSTRVTREAAEALRSKLPQLTIHLSDRRAITALEKSGAVFWVPAPERELGGRPGEGYAPHMALSFRLSDPSAFESDEAWLSTLGDLSILDLRNATTCRVLADVTPSLHSLSLAGAHLDDASLRQVTRFADLLWLDLSDTDISDDGIACLTVLKRLADLNVSGTHITDKSIAALAQCKRLERLDLSKTDISQSGRSALKTALPNCNVRS